jgi:hypothetical protein
LLHHKKSKAVHNKQILEGEEAQSATTSSSIIIMAPNKANTTTMPASGADYVTMSNPKKGTPSGRENVKSFSEPDKVMFFPTKENPMCHGGSVILPGGAKAVRLTMKPGCCWSKHIGPFAGVLGDFCPATHIGMIMQGTMTFKMDDGDTFDVSAGEAFKIYPGHDMEVTSDEDVIFYEFVA